ncbi:aminotransferase [Sphingomonas sp. Leaf357]|uniref:cysteine desulfurase family protein n=1 Tax=Sphingomonas sp. Leaf357 TaxID=1736350 RepID=UPI000700889D|nr:cysteine desulfurase family protein [Sphingomonas sp. Leaf357]KQS01414.1 aminotransferase [Sphingomonas sp. Leaf357]
MIYLDYQATTPLAPEAFEAMLPWLRDDFANPHSAHGAGRRAKAAVEVAREQVAALLPEGGRVSFTSGATEALNWALKGVGPGRIVTLATEHAAVLDTVEALARGGREVIVMPVGADGLVDPDVARAAIGPGTALVAAMLVNNEIGVIQPVAELARLAHTVGALMLCDAVQGFGRAAVPEACDLVAVSAHKVHGPKGIGALWVRDGIALEPLMHGGGQEAGGRSGTLSPALCVGFGVAARLMAELKEADAAHVDGLWRAAMGRLLGRHPGRVPGSTKPQGLEVELQSGSEAASWTPEQVRGDGWWLNGSAIARYHGNLNIRRDGLDVARLMSDLRDVAFSAGSACASGSGRSSHVLRAIGLTEAQARSSIRIGFGRYTTEEELGEAIERIVAAADAQRIAA